MCRIPAAPADAMETVKLPHAHIVTMVLMFAHVSEDVATVDSLKCPLISNAMFPKTQSVLYCVCRCSFQGGKKSQRVISSLSEMEVWRWEILLTGKEWKLLILDLAWSKKHCLHLMMNAGKRFWNVHKSWEKWLKFVFVEQICTSHWFSHSLVLVFSFFQILL